MGIVVKDETTIKINDTVKSIMKTDKDRFSYNYYEKNRMSIEVIHIKSNDTVLICRNDNYFLYSNNIGDRKLFDMISNDKYSISVRGGSRYTPGMAITAECYDKKNDKIENKDGHFVSLALIVNKFKMDVTGDNKMYTEVDGNIEKLELHHIDYVWDNRAESTMVVSHSQHTKLDSHSKKYGIHLNDASDLDEFIKFIDNNSKKNSEKKKLEMNKLGIEAA
jgi:hypothetical protein